MLMLFCVVALLVVGAVAARWVAYPFVWLSERHLSGRLGEGTARLLGWAAGGGLVVTLGAVAASAAGVSPLAGALTAGVGAALGDYVTCNWPKVRPLAKWFFPPPPADNRGLNRGQWQAARQRCFQEKGRLCVIGLRCCTGVATEIDHIRPLARGGAKYDQVNLQPSCGPCNRSKGTKSMAQLRWRRPVTSHPRRRRKLLARMEG